MAARNCNLEGATAEQLVARLLERTQPCHIVVDSSRRIVDWWGNAEHYGLSNLAVGADLHAVADFSVGIEPGDELDLPAVTTDGGIAASVEIRATESGGMSIMLVDTHSDFLRHYEVQQHANEVELLSRKQQELLQALTEAQAELAKKRAEAEQANLLKSRFIANLSHEFRTPLTSIIGYATLLRKQRISEHRDDIDAIYRSGQHLLSLVENLIDQGSVEEQVLKVMPRPSLISPLITDIEAMFSELAANKGLTLSVELHDLPDQPIVFDVERLRQILVNIIGNAVKFTRQGGVTVQFAWRVSRLTVTVRDSGTGIAPVDQVRVFQAFARAGDQQSRGAGLGLAISHRLVSLMGGDLQLESNPGQGSCFEFAIDAPLADVSASITTAITEDFAANEVPGARILIAEDDDDIALLLMSVLGDAGFVVDRVADGQDALQAGMASAPDLILLDINLPTLSGIEVVRRLRDADYSGKVVALTATAAREQEIAARSAGCDDYLVKTLGLDVLVSKLLEHLKSQSVAH